MYSSMITSFYVYVCLEYNLFTFKQIGKAAANMKLLFKIIYVETTLRCILFLIILTINWARSGKFFRILTEFVKLDTLLKLKLRVDIPTKQNYIFQIVYTVYVVSFGMYYCIQLYVEKIGLRLSIQWAILSNVNLIILSEFSILIQAFYIRFKLFNTFFMGMYKFPLTRSSKIKNYFNYSRVNQSPYHNLSNLNRFKLKELHIIYVTMRDLIREINFYYSFQVLLIVCETVAILIASISTLTSNSDNSVMKSTHRNLTLLHCAFRLVSVIALVHIAEKTSNEVSIILFY